MYYKKYGKRVMDIALSIVLCPVLLCFILVVGFLIKIEDSGPVFYKAERRGQFGKKFTMLKFRSMHINSPDIRNEDDSTFNSSIDNRVTKVGKVLRKTSIDELPQILSVLNGDMSFIGPRPNMATKKITDLTAVELNRLEVKPGITGLTQAFFRNSISQKEKYEYDIEYCENISLKLDLKIFLQTIKTVVLRKNINSGD